MSETHSECYGDVTRAPCSVVASVASFVEREYGDYAIGFVGRHMGASVDAGCEYVFQLSAPDGSRFLVAASRWGQPFHCHGTAWLAFAQAHKIEAYV